MQQGHALGKDARPFNLGKFSLQTSTLGRFDEKDVIDAHRQPFLALEVAGLPTRSFYDQRIIEIQWENRMSLMLGISPYQALQAHLQYGVLRATREEQVGAVASNGDLGAPHWVTQGNFPCGFGRGRETDTFPRGMETKSWG